MIGRVWLGIGVGAVAAAARVVPASGAQEAPTLVIEGGALFDAESATVRPLGQLWIAGARILGERPAGSATPAGAVRVDASGCTVLPGLFDLHAHVAVPGGPMPPTVMLDPEENLATAIAFGVTSVVDLHNTPDEVFPLRERARGAPDRARLFAAGPAFTVPGGHPTQLGFECNTVASREDVERRFESLLPLRPDLIKGVLEHGGWSTLPPLPTLSDELLGAVAARARAAGLPCFCHVWSLAEAKSAARAGVTALAHGVFLGEVDAELIATMKERGVGYVPTLSVVIGPRRIAAGRTPYTPERLDGLLDATLAAGLREAVPQGWAIGFEDADEGRWLANLRRLFEAGIALGIGTDAGNPITPHGPALLFELELYAAAGIPAAAVLKAATLGSARLLGVDRELGSIGAGKLADLVLVRGDPTRDLGAMWRIAEVVKEGRRVDRAALRGLLAQRAAGPTAFTIGGDVPATLDDFDDGDLDSNWGGTWSVTQDSAAPGGKSTAAIEPVESEGGGALLIQGELAEGFPFGSFAGATLQLDPQFRRVADLSAQRALRLRVRGTARRFNLVLERAAVRDFDVFTASIEVQEEWHEVVVPFDAFRQIGFGRDVPAGRADVRGLTIEARVPPGGRAGFGAFELEIDWIRVE